MKYIKMLPYIIDRLKQIKYIDKTFWNPEDIKYFYSKKEYKIYKRYIHILKKYHIL